MPGKLSETRFIFWDGVCNVDGNTGRVNGGVVYKEYLGHQIDRGQSFAPRAAAPLPAGTDGAQLRQILSNVVFPGIKVRIERVDDWFVPLADLLAIELRLRFVLGIQSLMLRIFECPPAGGGGAPKLVHQALLGRDEIRCLPVTDVSRGERQVVKQRRIATRGALPLTRCLTHYRVEVWISRDRGKFDACDANTPPDPACIHDRSLPTPMVPEEWAKPARGWKPADVTALQQAWDARIKHKRAKHSSYQGKNETLAGCVEIERIMADQTGLFIHDHEPADRVSARKRGDGKSKHDDFRATIRTCLYEICRRSPIAMALVRDVASAPGNGPLAIHVYPTMTVHDDIGGCGVSAAFPDNVAVEDELARLEDALQNGGDNDPDVAAWTIQVRRPADPADAARPQQALQAAGFSALKLVQLQKLVKTWGPHMPSIEQTIQELNPQHPDAAADLIALETAIRNGKASYDAKAAAAPPPAMDSKLDPNLALAIKSSARRLLYQRMGLSNPAPPGTVGCGAHFYFNVTFLPTFDKDQYRVLYHADGASHAFVIPDGARTSVRATVGVDAGGQSYTIETPLFLAFAHEMIHARRMQLGLNAEWDDFGKTVTEQKHPASMMERMRSGGVPADAIDNVHSRYQGWSREEWDTIEGGGAPVTLNANDWNAVQGILAPGDRGAGPNQVLVTENLLRKELGLAPRRRYVDAATRANPPTVQVPDALIQAPRRIISRAAPAPRRPPRPTPEPQDVTFAEIHSEMNALFADVGLAGQIQAFILEPGRNYFSHLDPKFGLAKFLGDTFIDEGVRESALPIFTQVAANPAAPAAVTDPAVAAALAGFAGAATDAQKVDAMRGLARALVRSTPLDQVERVLAQYPLLLEQAEKTSRKKGVEAFATVGADPAANHSGLGFRVMIVPDRAYSDSRNLCHMLIHEPMHGHSHGSPDSNFGFNAWDLSAGNLVSHMRFIGRRYVADITQEHAPSEESAQFALKNLLNEGATELFARIVSYRLNFKKGKVVSAAELFGGMPSYEYPTHWVSWLVRDLNGAGQNGLNLLARAYFLGQWQPLNQAIFNLSAESAPAPGAQFSTFDKEKGPFRKYGRKYFYWSARLGNDPDKWIGKNRSQESIDAMKWFKEWFCSPAQLADPNLFNYPNALPMLLPDELLPLTGTAAYRDPVLFPTPLLSRMDGRQQVQPQDVRPSAAEKEIHCPTCGEQVFVPARSFLKQSGA